MIHRERRLVPLGVSTDIVVVVVQLIIFNCQTEIVICVSHLQRELPEGKDEAEEIAAVNFFSEIARHVSINKCLVRARARVCATTIQSSGASANIRVVVIENFHIIRFLSLPLCSFSAFTIEKFSRLQSPQCMQKERNDDQLTRQLCLEGDKKVYGNKRETEAEREKRSPIEISS